MQRKLMTELENTKSIFGKKLKESKDEADHWKTQLELMAEDNAKQKQRLSEEKHRLHGENRQLKSRYNLKPSHYGTYCIYNIQAKCYRF